jgi:hypothetical protein
MALYRERMTRVTDAPGDNPPVAYLIPDGAGGTTPVFLAWVRGVGFMGVDELSGLAMIDTDYREAAKWVEARAAQHEGAGLKRVT